MRIDSKLLLIALGLVQGVFSGGARVKVDVPSLVSNSEESCVEAPNVPTLSSYVASLRDPEASPAVRLPQVYDILAGAAAELESSTSNISPSVERMRMILSDVRVVIETHPDLRCPPVDLKAGFEEVTNFLVTQYTTLAGLSRDLLWKGNCMLALARADVCGQVLVALPEDFVKDNLGVILLAATGRGNLEASSFIIRQCDLAVPDHSMALGIGIVLNGSLEFLRSLQERAPEVGNHLMDILALTIPFDAYPLFQPLLPELLRKHDESHHRDMVGTIFEYACILGNVDAVREILAHYEGLLATSTREVGLTQAVEYGQYPVAKLLLWEEENHRVRSFIQNCDLDYMVVLAARLNRVELLEHLMLELVDKQLCLNWARIIPRALCSAAEHGSLQAMDLLLHKCKTEHYLYSQVEMESLARDVLEKAVRNSRVEVLVYLEQRMNEADSVLGRVNFAYYNNHAIRVAADQGDLEIIQFLLRTDNTGTFLLPRIDPGASRNEALCNACIKGNFSIVKELLKTDQNGQPLYKTVDAGARNNAPLRCAAYYRRLDILKFLLQSRWCDAHGTYHYIFKGIDPTAKNHHVLASVAKAGSHELVEYLFQQERGHYLRPGIKVPRSLLKSVTKRNHCEVVRQLLRHPFVGDRREEINRALYTAQLHHRWSIVTLLQNALE